MMSDEPIALMMDDAIPITIDEGSAQAIDPTPAKISEAESLPAETDTADENKPKKRGRKKKVPEPPPEEEKPKSYVGTLVRNRHTGKLMHLIGRYYTFYHKEEGIYSDAYDDFVKRLVYRVTHDMQNVIIVDGETGSGKSAFALNICVDLARKLGCGFDLSRDYIYDLNDLWKKLDEDDANPINLLDEGTVTIASNTSQEKQARQFTTLLDTMRSKHWTTVICTPGYRRVNAVVRKDHADFKIRCASKTHPLVRGYGRGFFECRRVKRLEFQDNNKEPTWCMMYAGVFKDYPPIIREEYLAIKSSRQDVLTKRFVQEAKYTEAKLQKEQEKYITPDDKGLW